MTQFAPPPPPPPLAAPYDGDPSESVGGGASLFSVDAWNNLGPVVQGLFTKKCADGGGGSKQHHVLDAPPGFTTTAFPPATQPVSPLGPLKSPASAVCSNMPARLVSPSLSDIVDSPSRDELVPVPKRSRGTVRKTSARAKAKAKVGASSRVSGDGLFRNLEPDLGAAEPELGSPAYPSLPPEYD